MPAVESFGAHKCVMFIIIRCYLQAERMDIFFLGYLYDKLQFHTSYISVMYYCYIHPNALKCHVLKACMGLRVCLTQCTFAIIMMSCAHGYPFQWRKTSMCL